MKPKPSATPKACGSVRREAEVQPRRHQHDVVRARREQRHDGEDDEGREQLAGHGVDAAALSRRGAAADGGDAGAADLDQAERRHDGDELLDLDGAPGHLEDEMIDVASMTSARKASASRSASTRFSPCAGDLDQRQLALERPALGGEVGDRMHRHQPLELMLDLGRAPSACRW